MFMKILLLILSTTVLAVCGTIKTGVKFSNGKGKVDPYIVGGELVKGRQFPDLVSVNIKEGHICSGIIINPRWVLSTASAQWLRPDSVLVGTNQIDNGGTVHMIKETFLHERYNESDSGWVHDIALLKLATPIEYSDAVNQAVLPQQGEEVPVGSVGVIAGWGSLDYTSIYTANDLHSLEVYVYDQKKCQKDYERYNKTVYPTHLCAAPKVWGYGPTYGDSADPMYVDGKVVGIASWGRDRNSKDHPIVMTRISLYIDWIRFTMRL